jgi:hypothetical protein
MVHWIENWRKRMLNTPGRAVPTYIEGVGDICPIQGEEVQLRQATGSEVGNRAGVSKAVTKCAQR